MIKPDPASPWIVRKARPGTKLRLFCFPYSGAGASAFRGWGEAMPSIDVCAVQAPGRETRMREAPFLEMEPLVTEIVQAIRPLLDQPFAFFGHSLGAFVAYETARALRRGGAPAPLHFFASGCPSPHMHVVDEPIHGYSDARFMDELRRYAGTSEEVLKNDELMTLLLPVLRADFSVYETYRHPVEPPLDLPITALGGLEDEEASREQLDGWRAHTSKGFVLRMFPGNHFFLHPMRTRLLGTVLQDLAGLLR